MRYRSSNFVKYYDSSHQSIIFDHDSNFVQERIGEEEGVF